MMDRLKRGALVFSAVVAFGYATSASADVVYSSNFASDAISHAAAEFTGANTVVTAPGDAATGNAPLSFLGILTQGATAKLLLTGLIPNTAVNLSFDLYALNSLDGDGEDGYGPDNFIVTANNLTLMNNTFAGSSSATQSYPVPQSVGSSGAASYDPKGFGFITTYSSALVYEISLNAIVDSSGDVLFSFDGHSTEAWPNEGFGVNNVIVTSYIPEPSSIFPFGLGLLGLVFLALHRSKKAGFFA